MTAVYWVFVTLQMINCVCVCVMWSLIYIQTVLAKNNRLLGSHWGMAVVKPQSLGFNMLADTHILHSQYDYVSLFLL